MFLLVYQIGHPYARTAPENQPPRCVMVEAPTLRECVGVFENQTGWSLTGGTPCCGDDFAAHVFAEEPTEWDNPWYDRSYRKVRPLSEYGPIYLRAQELPPEATHLDDERWEDFCEEFDWILKYYDDVGRPLETPGRGEN